MNKTLLIFTLLFSTINYSQVQKIFYVDDAKTIDYVTVNFCVDNNARISEVTILPKKTTYKNTDIIKQLIDYLKGIQYHSDSKLRNNCYDSTFEFINSKYEKLKLSETEFEKCKNIRTGEFKYMHISYPETIIYRTETTQIEKDSESIFEYKIEWKSPNEYSLIYSKVPEKEYEDLIGETINVEIIDILDDEHYVYRSNLLDRTILTGVIKKIK